ncbi:MAG: hypothetical protein K8H74_18100 [Notoacmeibacter sp.]|nr:hypothetical protein [Notoacmeibacter sp.]
MYPNVFSALSGTTRQIPETLTPGVKQHPVEAEGVAAFVFDVPVFGRRLHTACRREARLGALPIVQRLSEMNEQPMHALLQYMAKHTRDKGQYLADDFPVLERRFRERVLAQGMIGAYSRKVRDMPVETRNERTVEEAFEEALQASCVDRYHRVTQQVTAISIAYDADRRRDPSPIHTNEKSAEIFALTLNRKGLNEPTVAGKG